MRASVFDESRERQPHCCAQKKGQIRKRVRTIFVTRLERPKRLSACHDRYAAIEVGLIYHEINRGWLNGTGRITVIGRCMLEQFQPVGFNPWATKTVETLPGGTQNVTYANYAGQVMLSVKIPGAGRQGNGPWYEFFRYDSSDRVIMKAESSVVAGVTGHCPKQSKV